MKEIFKGATFLFLQYSQVKGSVCPDLLCLGSLFSALIGLTTTEGIGLEAGGVRDHTGLCSSLGKLWGWLALYSHAILHWEGLVFTPPCGLLMGKWLVTWSQTALRG